MQLTYLGKSQNPINDKFSRTNPVVLWVELWFDSKHFSSVNRMKSTAGSLYLFSSCLQRVGQVYSIGFRQLLHTTSFDTLEQETAMNYSVHSHGWMPVSRETLWIEQHVLGFSSWLNTRSLTFSVFSLTCTECSLLLPGCRSAINHTHLSDFL